MRKLVGQHRAPVLLGKELYFKGDRPVGLLFPPVGGGGAVRLADLEQQLELRPQHHLAVFTRGVGQQVDR